MASYEEITANLLTWARRCDAIRAVIVIGSRARTVEPADAWSDLDVILVAEDAATYVRSASWIEALGTPLLTFTERAFEGSWERRVLYEGFLDVDFALIDPANFRASSAHGVVCAIFRRGYRVLLDKDDWAARIAEACASSQGDALEDAATPEAIANEMHDYWYHCVWTAKKLQRGEMWTAMSCLNCYMKAKLLSMVEHYTRIAADAPVDTWHNGRLLETWADPTVLHRLPGSFADYDAQALVAALRHQMELYHTLAVPVAAHYGIAYPVDAVRAVRAWIHDTREG